MFFSNQQGVSYWAIIIVLAFMVIAMIVAFWPRGEVIENDNMPSHIRLWLNAKNQALKLNEKAKIEKWIVDNELNQYGDSADILYAGGTPLFDESTGEMMDRWEYIKKNHPDEPWNK